MTQDPAHSSSARQYAFSVSESELVQYAEGLRRLPRFGYPPENPVMFVKVGGPEIHAEGDMQKLAFEWLGHERQRTKCNIYIPEVYRIFKRDGRTFLLMQYVEATPICWLLRDNVPFWLEHEPECHDLIAEGIRLLSHMPLPSDVTLGRYSSVKTHIRHPLFKDQDAPLIYRDVQEMEHHLNRIAAARYRIVRPPPEVTTVSFKDEPLVYCYSDYNDENFLFEKDADGRPRLWIVDFGHAAFLPVSFLAYAVSENRWYTNIPLQDRLGKSLPQHNVEVMKDIFYMFQISVWNMCMTKEQRESIRRGEHSDGWAGSDQR